jgi:ligand-binding sensor domain-containing protein/serine phosphatase RsbU (regulator of sigma subunit)
MRKILLLLSNKIIRHFSLMFLFFVAISTGLKSQTYFFEKYGVEEGLSSSRVYSILQDKMDHIWIGTESGVSMFNGSGFKNYSTNNGLASGGVYSIFEDSLGRVWFGHLSGGISLYDGESFKRIRIDSIIIDSDVTSIRQFGNYLWLTTATNGAFRANFPDNKDSIIIGKQYKGMEGLSDQVHNSYIDRSNNLYCLTGVGIKRYNVKEDRFETFSPEGLTKYWLTISMFEDSKGNFWYGTYNGGLYKYDKDSDKWIVYDKRDGLSKNWISFITEDYRGSIWVGTWGGGITLFSGNKMSVFNETNGLKALNVHYIVQDREKNMLIADYYTGISIYKGDHFLTYSSEKYLPENNVWAVAEDNLGRYWFGTNGGISIYDPKVTGKNMVKFLNESRNTIGNSIRFIKPDKDGNIWIGTNGSGIYEYDIKTNKLIYNTTINGYLSSLKIITALEIDKNNNLWIGDHDRLNLWNIKKEEISTFTQSDGLAGNEITALFCDSKGIVWIGSDAKSGLTRYDPGTNKFQIIKIGDGVVPKAITETSGGSLWLGTTGGLLELKEDSIVQKLNESNGLLSNNIQLLLFDGGDYLYIGTNSGLNRYNIKDRSISGFTKRSGFIGIEAHPNAAFKDSKGNLWFGTANGVTMLAPEKLPPVNTIPLTHINSMEVNYQQREMKAGLKLNYKEKSVIFNYYSVCLTDPGAVKYKVMLKGAETGWRPETDQTMAIYSALSPGHYTFRVKASNSFGYWNETPIEYSFIIKPPFYLSPWFIISCVFVLIFSIISYIKIRERNLIREKKILEAKVEERTAEVVQKSAIIEEKNRDITASIRYAERIQRAMLPREDTFGEAFVLFLPKDIVSGDFYWMYDDGDTKFLAAVDCTGHGVPGAFMSIIGHNSLNKAVREYGLTRPSAILDQLNIEVIKSILQSQEKGINDGMDLALIAFDRKKFTLEFAGAYNPLYLVRNGEIIVYKADRFPIGMATLEQKKTFTNQTVDIQPGDMLYMCSDGYADQFGSSEVKKFKSVNIKRILSEIWNLPVHEQKDRLEKEIMDWKGDLPQVDDIMFIGTKVPNR